MPNELETAAGLSIGGWLRRKKEHAAPPGTPCANCATPLEGPYCHVCGQFGEDYHKSIWKLTVESIESLLHFDGRLWQTLPRLLAKPGGLTRDYLDGKRAFQIPPFRMFLVILLIAFFVGHQASKSVEFGEVENVRVGMGGAQARQEIAADPNLSPAEKAMAEAALDGDLAAVGEATRARAEENRQGATASVGQRATGAEGERRSGATLSTELGLNDDTAAAEKLQHWFEERAKAVNDDPERFFLILEIWAHRVAVAALPVSAILLTLLFVFQRRFYVFDHLVFSMHSLSFQLILLTTILGLTMLIGTAAWWLALLAPVHLFLHMRGTYGTSVAGTLLRMALLWFLSTLAFTALALLWLYLGFNEMAGGH